ncbi:Rv1679 family acyl-CoA dehydrogenase [Streptomyces antarcticus]|uniref:Rv1679 family acyl-CoA dehydrogenase n=1 Tax=Streptomyces antarcticus TaxID=2996458 RepID=UPI00226E2EAC|nr:MULTISPECIES: acyl-CoA dehydrogenase family protein [unclassified Streptomyces]MCY0945463.1 acyl-CoA/acyl-ACP dehydrogenase [Streptomyces sp. H34-AA3]MCZ4084916.1 acyl-CoA/acyl-ACP dehydrogenase [Streptomyces sp. H34-S5]
MNVDSLLQPVLATATEHAPAVDTDGRFPEEAVAALGASGLLGLTLPEPDGGLGAGPEEFAHVTAELAGVCGSTAMVYLMHISGAMTVLAAAPPGMPDLPGDLATGRALATLAFSEPGSRSHFWAPISQAKRNGGQEAQFTAEKSWVTSAGHAQMYITSVLSADEAGTVDLYAIEADAPGVAVTDTFHGLGLRGNASAPMRFDMTVPDTLRLGASGSGLTLMTETVMPWFNLGNAAVSLGLARAALNAAVRHTSGATLQHLGQRLAELPTIRARLARMSLQLEAAHAYLRAAAASIAAPDEQTPLYVLGVKALANDTALTVTDDAMRVCGGAAFSQHLAIERFFRDARAGHVMAPTADVLYDFYGKAITGQPVFG